MSVRPWTKSSPSSMATPGPNPATARFVCPRSQAAKLSLSAPRCERPPHPFHLDPAIPPLPPPSPLHLDPPPPSWDSLLNPAACASLLYPTPPLPISPRPHRPATPSRSTLIQSLATPSSTPLSLDLVVPPQPPPLPASHPSVQDSFLYLAPPHFGSPVN